MTQVLKPIKISIFAIILSIGAIALITELTQYEEIAKIIVIPSLVLLILVAGYAMFKTMFSEY